MAQKFLQQENKKTCTCFREIKRTNLLTNQRKQQQKTVATESYIRIKHSMFVLLKVPFVQSFNTKGSIKFVHCPRSCIFLWFSNLSHHIPLWRAINSLVAPHSERPPFLFNIKTTKARKGAPILYIPQGGGMWGDHYSHIESGSQAEETHTGNLTSHG